MFVSESFHNVYKNQFSEKAFLHNLGTVFSNSKDWDGGRLVRALKRKRLSGEENILLNQREP